MSAAVPQPNVPAELGEKLFLKEGKQAFFDSVEPADLVYFLLNVGDGDTQLFLLPARAADGVRRAFVVDVATTGKLPGLLQTLLGTNLLPRVPDDGYLFPLVVATHPHDDHIGGMPEFLTGDYDTGIVARMRA